MPIYYLSLQFKDNIDGKQYQQLWMMSSAIKSMTQCPMINVGTALLTKKAVIEHYKHTIAVRIAAAYLL